jgi:hypothetical protein
MVFRSYVGEWLTYVDHFNIFDYTISECQCEDNLDLQWSNIAVHGYILHCIQQTQVAITRFGGSCHLVRVQPAQSGHGDEDVFDLSVTPFIDDV